MPPSAHPADRPEPLIGAVFSSYRVPEPAGSVRLMLVGELDLVTAQRAREAVRRAQNEARVVICDLGDVWFVDVAGLLVLFEASAHAALTGGRLTIACCPPIMPRMLRLLKLEDALDIQPPPPAIATPDPRRARLRGHVS